MFLTAHHKSLTRVQNADVRLNVISKLDVVQEVIGVDQVASVLVPEIVAMARDPQWRVRLAIIERLPMLAKSLGPVAFDAKLTPACLVSI